MLPTKELQDVGREETKLNSKVVDENIAKQEYNMEDLLEIFCTGKSWTPWTQQEDEVLIALVTQLGSHDWQEIAKRLSATTGIERLSKSCRQRWTDQLDPKLNHRPFTLGESELVVKYQKVHGNHWSLIASKLGNRSANMVKNHWYSMKRKFVRIKTQGSMDITRGSSPHLELPNHKDALPMSEGHFGAQVDEPSPTAQAKQAASQMQHAQFDLKEQLTRSRDVSLSGGALPGLCRSAGAHFSYEKKLAEPNVLVARHVQTVALQGFLAPMPYPLQVNDQQYTCVTLNLLGTSRVPSNPKLPRM